MDTSARQEQLSQLEACVNDFNAEVTMILQSLQWDRKHVLENKPMSVCQHDPNHRVPPDKLAEHEEKCFLKSLGYSKEDCLLPAPLDPDASSVVKLSTDNVADIIDYATKCNLILKKAGFVCYGCFRIYFLVGPGCGVYPPLTLERLQASYSADERLAIHAAVVNLVPSCHDLSDLALPSLRDNEEQTNKPKSKVEILAELRDMKRRRTKYRVPPKARNYSYVLRDVISTQMEMYTEAKKNNYEDRKVNCSDNNGDHEVKLNKNGDKTTRRKDYEGHSSKTAQERYRQSEENENKRKLEDSPDTSTDRQSKQRKTVKEEEPEIPAYKSEHASLLKLSNSTCTCKRGKFKSYERYESKRLEENTRGEKRQRMRSDNDKKYLDDRSISSENHQRYKYYPEKERSKHDKSHKESREGKVDTPKRDTENQIEAEKIIKKEKAHSPDGSEYRRSEAHTSNVDTRIRIENARMKKSYASNKDRRETSKERRQSKINEIHVKNEPSENLSHSSQEYRKSNDKYKSYAENYSKSYEDYRNERYDKKDRIYDKYDDHYKRKDTKRSVKESEMERTGKYRYAEEPFNKYETYYSNPSEEQYKRYYDDTERSYDGSRGSKADRKRYSDTETYRDKYRK